MAIIVGTDTKLVVQGATGREGSFHTLRNRNYGTDVVAGVTPGKGGRDLEGVPIFDTVAEAVEEAGANTSMVFVPARFAADAIYESVDAGIGTVICIAEGLPAHEMLRIYNYIRPRGITMLGPNCPGALSPGKANVGIIPAEGDRPRLALRDADVSDRPRADPARARQLDDRRYRGRSRRRLLVHRRAREVRGRRRDRGRRPGRRNRR
jgi:succinyl-CoA synthetase alpha subunit